MSLRGGGGGGFRGRGTRGRGNRGRGGRGGRRAGRGGGQAHDSRPCFQPYFLNDPWAGLLDSLRRQNAASSGSAAAGPVLATGDEDSMEIALDLDVSDEDAGENDEYGDRDDEPRTSSNSPYPSADQEDDLPTVPQKRPRSAVSDLDDERTDDSDKEPRVTHFPASPTASEVPPWNRTAADEPAKHVAMGAPHLDPLLIPPLPVLAGGPSVASTSAPVPPNGTVSSALTTPAASPLMSLGGPLSPGTPWHMYSRHNFAREGAPSPRDVTLSFLPPPAIASRESSAEPVVPTAIGLMGPPTAPPPRTGLVLPPPIHAMPLPAWERFPAPAPPAPPAGLVTGASTTGAATWSSPGRSLTSRSPSPGWTVTRRGTSVSRETTPAPPTVTDGIMMGSASPTPTRPSPTKVRALGSTGPFGFGVEDSPTRCNDHGDSGDEVAGRGQAPSPTP